MALCPFSVTGYELADKKTNKPGSGDNDNDEIIMLGNNLYIDELETTLLTRVVISCCRENWTESDSALI